MSARSIVSIVRCEDYDQGRVDAAVREALDLAELSKLFASGSKVLLKPNLLSTRKPEEAVTTHPAVVRALGEIALRRQCVPSIGDSPPFSGENPAKWQRLMDVTGMSAVSAELGIPMIRFEESVAELQSPQGRIYHSFQVAASVLEADTLVNICKLKTHGLTKLTGAVKNVFGCVPGVRKGLFHAKAAEDRVTFAQMLVDLCQALGPGVNVMDAVVALEGEGPNSGSPRHIGAILASSDPVALDAVASALIGVDPMSVDTTRLAHEQGLGWAEISEIEMRGTPLEDLAVTDFRMSSGSNEWGRIPSPVRQFLRRQLVPSPVISRRSCIACGDCASACPVAAITAGRPYVVDQRKCIRCYCCHEVCNAGAVALRQGLVGRLVSRTQAKK